MRAPAALVAAFVLLSGCLAEEPAGADLPAGGPERTDAAAVAAHFHNFTGKLTGTPAVPATQDFPVEVPKGAVELQATLAWTSPVADLRLQLLDPRGDEVEAGFKETGTQRSAATLDPPASGTWTVRVTATRALEEAFTVAARVMLLQPGVNVLADEVQIGGSSLFAEVNVIMEEGASFNWSFEATGPVHYDIHSHEDGETTYHERGTAAEKAGVFTAPKRQIYSLLFAPPDAGEGNPSPTPVTVSYRMEGAFRVHSHSQ